MSIRDKCQDIADAVQARLSGVDKKVKLFEELADKDERIQKLTGEVTYWKEKFDNAWSAWNRLAIETKGVEEAKKMADAMKAAKQ